MVLRLDYTSLGDRDDGDPIVVFFFKWLACGGAAAVAVCVVTWVLMRSFQQREGGDVLDRPDVPRERVAVYRFWLGTVPSLATPILLGATLGLGMWKMRRRGGMPPMALFVVAHLVLWFGTMVFVHGICGDSAFP